MKDIERFEKQMAFIREIDKEKMIKRQSYLSDCETHEDDAQHAWHMAIMTLLLKEYSNEDLDVLKTMSGEYLKSLWLEFEEQKTPEAKFARTMDCFQPLILNDATDGRAWKEHDVRKSWVMKRNQNTHKGSEDIWEYARENLIEKNVQKGNIIDDSNE